MEFRDKTFSGEEITLDGNTFTGCTFRRCRIVFRATAPCFLSANGFIDCSYHIDGPAGLTLAFLNALYRGGGKELVEQTFENIKSGKYEEG